jgi:hypothetical protein
MGLPGRTRIATVVLMLVIGCVLPHRSWGQETDRIGTVLVVEGIAEVRAQDATQWEPLRFRDAVFLNDTVRTAKDSKIKVLLRDDTIMTLAEDSEMEFTEFLLTEQQRNTVVNLLIGRIRVLTTRIFGAGSATEVHTPNAVAGVRGSEENVQYDEVAQKTRVLCVNAEAEAPCYMRDPKDPTKFLYIPEGHLAEQVGFELPTSTRLATPGERQEIARGTTATAQVPAAVQTAAQREQIQIAGPSARSELPSVLPLAQALAPAPSPTTDVEQAVQENQVDFRQDTHLTPLGSNPGDDPSDNPEFGSEGVQAGLDLEGGGGPTAGDNPAADEFIEQSTLSLTITIPR